MLLVHTDLLQSNLKYFGNITNSILKYFSKLLLVTVNILVCIRLYSHSRFIQIPAEP